MKTAELKQLTASEMEAIGGGIVQNGSSKPRLGKLIIFLLLLLLFRRQKNSVPLTPIEPA
jgi:hypothetical protein